MSAAADWLSEPELIVDLFAGGGGASLGIEAALGRPIDIAINHSRDAIRMHERNHPFTRHYIEDVWKVDPRVACGSGCIRWSGGADRCSARDIDSPTNAKSPTPCDPYCYTQFVLQIHEYLLLIQKPCNLRNPT